MADHESGNRAKGRVLTRFSKVLEEHFLKALIHKLKKHQFLFEELVKRDFKQKYKRTVLGMGWSVLAPLLTLLVMKLVFGHFYQNQRAKIFVPAFKECFFAY